MQQRLPGRRRRSSTRHAGGSCLSSHPDATAGQVKQAYREKMKECHPDRVAGLAPQIQKLANEMAQRLTAALDQYSGLSTP